MASCHNWRRERRLHLASNISVIQRVVLVLLLRVIVITAVVHCAGDGRGSGGEEGVPAVSRRCGDSINEFPGNLGQRRGLVENGDAKNSIANERPLAVKRGRLDPFNDFHEYRAGYDVESKHYWGSLVVTGLPGYAIAVGWLVLGFLLLLSTCCARCCCRRRRSHLTYPEATPPKVLYLWTTIMVATVLTMAVIAGSVVLYVGSRDFTVQARKVEHSLKDTAANVTGIIDALTTAIVDVEELLEPFSGTAIISVSGISLSTLNSTEETLARESENISHTMHKNMRILDKIITALDVVLMVVASLNLGLIFVGPVFLLLHWKRSIYVIVSTAWILTGLTAFLFGISFALDNLVKDTCDAMNEYQAEPYNTTLDALLPCQDLQSASGALADLGEGIRNSLSQVNSTLIQAEGQLNSSLPVLCQPIGPPPTYEYIGSCPDGTIPIADLPKELEPFKCTSNDTQACSQQGQFITAIQYTEIVAYATGIQILLDVYPSITGLTNCSIVVETFDKLLTHNCGPTKAAARLVWDAFITLTISMILLVLWWLFLRYRSKERKQDTTIFPVLGSPKKHKNES